MKKKYYKLTKRSLKTYNGCQWKIGEWKETSGEGELCSKGWLHAYTHPLLAVFLNSIHADIYRPRLFEIEVGGKTKTDYGLKVGFTKMRLLREIPLPKVTDIQRIAFGILCVNEIETNKIWQEWANNWLNGKDRTASNAYYCSSRYANDKYANEILTLIARNMGIKFIIPSTIENIASEYPINLIKLAKKAVTIN